MGLAGEPVPPRIGSGAAVKRKSQRLRAAAEEAGRGFDAQLAASATLRDDLHLLIERGDQFADRLETMSRVGRRTAQDHSQERELAKTMVRKHPRERPPVEPPSQNRTQNRQPMWPKASILR